MKPHKNKIPLFGNEIITKAATNNYYIIGIFLDFSKAFDTAVTQLD